MKINWIPLVIALVVGLALGIFGTIAVPKILKPNINPGNAVVGDTTKPPDGTITTGDFPSEVDKLKSNIDKLNAEKKKLQERVGELEFFYGSAAISQQELEQRIDNLLAKGTIDSADINDLRKAMVANTAKMEAVRKALEAAKKQLDNLNATNPSYTYKRLDFTFRMGLAGGVGYGLDSYYYGLKSPDRKGYVDASAYAKILYWDTGKAGVYTLGFGQSLFRPKSYIFVRRGIKDIIPFMRNTGIGLQYTYDWNKEHEIQAALGVDF